MNALLSRRRLILVGMATAVAGGIGGLAWLRPAAAGFRVLSAGEAALVEALAATFFPAGRFPVSGGDGGTAPGVDALLAETLDPSTTPAFRYLLRALDVATFATHGRTFTALDAHERFEVLDVWSGPDPLPRRLAADGLRVLVGMAFLRRPQVLQHIGWQVGCAAGGGAP